MNRILAQLRASGIRMTMLGVVSAWSFAVLFQVAACVILELSDRAFPSSRGPAERTSRQRSAVVLMAAAVVGALNDSAAFNCPESIK
ncbi:hypothetical protein BCR44DRAFT_350458 [Catenaria anguillulae PL171]|uniref:Uncharacterized protein n=1 Tax=Catenaria anguillulae PL171 TaxID=765915 RepID=A0A1Y2HIT2_9FUNG|nr:hypothetical protein BCR44DRAFT_350458 [Catenaria anguillulae PL171]